MKILWVANQPIATLRNMLNIPLGQSGGWMEKAYETLKGTSGLVLGVATIYKGDEVLHSVEDGNDFYAIPSQQAIADYDYKDQYNLGQWAAVISDFHPDLIHIWGTEYSIGLCAIKSAKGIPSVVYMQGMMNQLANHYCDGISLRAQLQHISIIDIKRWNFLWTRKGQFAKAAAVEAETLKMANNAIVESDWCAYNCLSVAPDCTIYRSLLPISPVFFNYDWNYDECEKYSIFTVAGGYPIKGHHILLKAFARVVELYPEAKLYIPGTSNVLSSDFSKRIRMTSYDRLISSMIKKYRIKNNIVYTGRLTPEEMAARIARSHVYVMPSSCENHSSSLIEAMIVGVPTISTYVGGISQYYKDGENGLFYRFNEPEVLAAIIVEYFKNRDLAIRVAEKGKNNERQSRSSIDIRKDFLETYKSIINRHK